MTGTSPAIAGVFANRYAIERELGHGGTSVVYLARDTRDGRAVAIKILRHDLAETVGADRFLREIRLTQQLDHPHILPVLDSGTHDGHLFFVLPHMEGGTLRDRLERDKQQPLAQVVAITKTIATALTYAHAQGLIHRDVKPENILFSDGEARLGDFGIARALERSIEDTTTSTGIVRGTPPYMSPEQISGGRYDGRSDTYSLACVVYEMLAGILPYVGPTQESVIAQKMVHPPRPLRVYRPTMSAAIEDVVTRALAMSPADRYQSSAEFAEAFERAAEAAITTGGAAASRGESPARRIRWIAAALGIVVVAAVLTLRFAARTDTRLDPNRIMIFPLSSVARSPGASMGEDAATMISSAIDGAGPLRSVDAWPLLQPGMRDTIRLLTGPAAARVAHAHRSGRYITGKIVESGDSTWVFLDVWDTDSAAVIGRARVAGVAGASDVWRLTLRAVNELLVRLIPGSARNTLAGWEDRNPAAIASFLVGESAFRRGRYSTALDRYRDAVRVDSQFALAAIRGAQAAAWKHRPEEAAAFVKIAQRGTLPIRYAHFARAYAAYLEGSADSAVVALRAALREDPNMAVAWVQLGETYTHLLPTLGAPDSLAQDAFDRAISLDSSATAAFYHPIQIALRRGDLARADRMLAPFVAAAPDSMLLRHVEIMGECVRKGAANVNWAALARQRPFPLLNAAYSLGAGGARFSCAGSAFERLLSVDTSRTDNDADGRRWAALLGLVGVRLAQKRSADAAAAVDSFNARWNYGGSVFLLAGPLDSLMAARARDVARADSALHGATYARLGYNFRLWAIGQFKLHDGGVAVADAIARDLASRADSSKNAIDRLLARSLQARVALARGDSAGARHILEQIVPTRLPGAETQWHEMASAPGERLLLARLDMARGNPDRAIELANVIDSPAAAIHLLYVAQSLDLRLRAASASGERRTESMLRQRIAALSGM